MILLCWSARTPGPTRSSVRVYGRARSSCTRDLSSKNCPLHDTRDGAHRHAFFSLLSLFGNAFVFGAGCFADEHYYRQSGRVLMISRGARFRFELSWPPPHAAPCGTRRALSHGDLEKSAKINHFSRGYLHLCALVRPTSWRACVFFFLTRVYSRYICIIYIYIYICVTDLAWGDSFSRSIIVFFYGFNLKNHINMRILTGRPGGKRLIIKRFL